MAGEVDVEFESEGAILRGRLFRATRGEPPFPVVVMAMGTSATTSMVGDRYAGVFAAAGISALLYDHRGFGRSGGEPRQQINPWIQCRGYRDAVGFASTIPGHDPRRIALWGSSFAAGEAFLVAACDRRVAAVVAQCPVFGPAPPAVQPGEEVFAEITAILDSADLSEGPGDITGPLPVVTFDPVGAPALLEPIQAFRWFLEYGGRPGSGWVNRVTRLIPSTSLPYSPYLCAPHLKVPCLMVVSPSDEMAHANPRVSRGAFDLVPAEKEWHEIEGGHFGLLYEPGRLFAEASAMEADFLTRHLLASQSSALAGPPRSGNLGGEGGI